MFPDFFKNPSKISARQQITRIYRKKTGDRSIPTKSGQYWCLCGWQNKRGSEINQMVKNGLIKCNQFYGVDRDSEKCKRNKQVHPKANWFCGEWEEVIRSTHFNPSIIYLDTTNFANKFTSWELVKFTMPLCSKDTFLFINVMLNNSRSIGEEFDKNDFVKGLKKSIPNMELKKWIDIAFFWYKSTKHTKMGTFVYQKI